MSQRPSAATSTPRRLTPTPSVTAAPQVSKTHQPTEASSHTNAYASAPNAQRGGCSLPQQVHHLSTQQPRPASTSPRPAWGLIFRQQAHQPQRTPRRQEQFLGVGSSRQKQNS
ncbi:hypothetical protein PIB30_085501 [Stylosanthes scabra]|uniref:Uncharacterized protein n=1 Tax=Stylosanthes scabra TaxID=79078 RepID=A0ABU6VSJ2_9FABA|nr:hypothetical protein [Stylosanthes scabra]